MANKQKNKTIIVNDFVRLVSFKDNKRDYSIAIELGFGLFLILFSFLVLITNLYK